jgi:pyruvate/2-oxoglutarate/acetoin dehydrogenase E1 component
MILFRCYRYAYPTTGELEENHASFEIKKAKIRRQGADVTLITFGGSLPKTLQAAKNLRAEGIDAEVIDLRVLRPLDT